MYITHSGPFPGESREIAGPPGSGSEIADIIGPDRLCSQAGQLGAVTAVDVQYRARHIRGGLQAGGARKSTFNPSAIVG